MPIYNIQYIVVYDNYYLFSMYLVIDFEFSSYRVLDVFAFHFQLFKKHAFIK